ncbi:MAG: TraB/GumN family protein [Muribaculum sp.]
MKKVLFAMALLLTAGAANSQLLWKISGKDAKGDSYLFGTHHVAPVSLIDTTPGFKDAMAGVDAVYGEIDMSEMTSPSAQQVIMSAAMAPADSTVTKLLTAEQIDSVNAVLGKYTNGMLKLDQLAMFKPRMIDTQLGMLQTMVAFPEFNGQEQLDNTIQLKCRELGKNIKGFETLEQQMNLLMSGSMTEQASDLMESVRKDSEAAEKARKLANAYMSADINTIETMFLDPDLGMDEKSHKMLIDDRNADWLKQLSSILPSESVFIAVGAGHLIGDTGLIKELQKAGYTVTPVK